MNEILKAYKFRIYPTDEQIIGLNKTFGCVRLVWNEFVANFNSYGTDDYNEKLSEKDLKQEKEFLSEVSAAALQQKRMDFVETKKQFFNKRRKKKSGRMKFKKRGVSNESFRLPNQKFKINQYEKFIRIEKIGKIPIVIDRELPEDTNYRSVTV